MSFRQNWLDRFACSNFGPARRSRRAGFQRLPVEALEDRKYLSATMTLTDSGHTLNVVGDRSDNHIEIVQDDRGVHVTADGAALDPCDRV